jgi:hypothetical protein
MILQEIWLPEMNERERERERESKNRAIWKRNWPFLRNRKTKI